MINEAMSKMREAKDDCLGWWRKRLQLLRGLANGVRGQVIATLAIKRAEISVGRKRIQARIKSRLGIKAGDD